MRNSHGAHLRFIFQIDIEGHELYAVPHAIRLFDQVFLPYIIMEWEVMQMQFKEDEYNM